MSSRIIPDEEIRLFKELVDENRYNFCKLVFIIFPFGEKGHELEKAMPYTWQMEEWAKLSKHLSNPLTRYDAYRLIISSGNGAAKTAFGAMTFFMLMYTQKLRARITANTHPQMKSVVWPEYDIWYRHARYSDFFFEKLGESIKAKDPEKAETWRLDTITWNEATPTAISGLHNKGKAIAYIFEEAPGIPANIWTYASGAMTDVDTIKLWMAFGNSDDPESKFEQNMSSPSWNARRIDTRTMSHVDPKQVQAWLDDCGGNEDHDDFRVRVRGLPRKQAKDSIISMENVMSALDKGVGFNTDGVNILPSILAVDPAWTGGDETVIWHRQGNYARLLEKYKLDKTLGQDHMYTYLKMVKWEQELFADAVFIDQGEGTALKTIANANGKNWELIAFSNAANDAPTFKESLYSNIRAQMYYKAAEWLKAGGALDSKETEWKPEIQKQLCWTKGTRHKIHGKKLAEAKQDIKERVGQSPDIADGFVLTFAREVLERLPENERHSNQDYRNIGNSSFLMPNHTVDYDVEEDAYDVYN